MDAIPPRETQQLPLQLPSPAPVIPLQSYEESRPRAFLTSQPLLAWPYSHQICQHLVRSAFGYLLIQATAPNRIRIQWVLHYHPTCRCQCQICTHRQWSLQSQLDGPHPQFRYHCHTKREEQPGRTMQPVLESKPPPHVTVHPPTPHSSSHQGQQPQRPPIPIPPG